MSTQTVAKPIFPTFNGGHVDDGRALKIYATEIAAMYGVGMSFLNENLPYIFATRNSCLSMIDFHLKDMKVEGVNVSGIIKSGVKAAWMNHVMPIIFKQPQMSGHLTDKSFIMMFYALFMKNEAIDLIDLSVTETMVELPNKPKIATHCITMNSHSWNVYSWVESNTYQPIGKPHWLSD